MEDDEIIYVNVHRDGKNPWDTDPFAPMNVTSYRGMPSQKSDLGEIYVDDDDGFARAWASGLGWCHTADNPSDAPNSPPVDAALIVTPAPERE